MGWFNIRETPSLIRDVNKASTLEKMKKGGER